MAVAVASAATFGVAGTLATSLLRAGWTPASAVTARLVVASLALALPGWRAWRRRPLTARLGARTGRRRRAGMVGAYGLLAVAGAQLCYFQAIEHLSVAVALLLEYSGTVLVVGWMWVRHRQVPSRASGWGAGVALAGLVLVLNLAGSHQLDPVGILWGMGAAVGLAAYFVVSADHDDALPSMVVAWGGLTVGALTMAVVAVAGVFPWRSPLHDVVLAHTRVSWLVPVIGIGLVPGAVAYVTGIAAARALGARLASFVGLAEVLAAAVYAWLLLGQRLGLMQLVGGLVVLGGIAMVRMGEPVPEPVPVPVAVEEPQGLGTAA